MSEKKIAVSFKVKEIDKKEVKEFVRTFLTTKGYRLYEKNPTKKASKN